MTLGVTLLPGDGVGPEVTAAARRVLDASGVDIAWDVQEAGWRAYERGGEALPERVLASIRRNGLALKGPLATPVGGPFGSVNVALRRELGLHSGIRPAAGRGIDVVVVRMAVEDLYAGIECGAGTDAARAVRDALGPGGRRVDPSAAIAIRPLSEAAARRTARAAFAYARREGRRRVTAVHKATVMPETDGLFLAVAREVAAEHPDVDFDDRLVDTACAELATRPERFDVLLAPMLYGDVLSDLAAALAGGLGVAPGANVGEACAVFEAVHGTAARLAGRDVANPTALVLSGAMLLRHAGRTAAAERVEQAVAAVIAEGRCVTYDLRPDRDEGRASGTAAMTEAVVERLASAAP